MFDYAHMRNLRPHGRQGFAMQIGIWWSRVLELFYKELQFGQPPSQTQMLKFASEAWVELEMQKLQNEFNKAFAKFGGPEGALLMASEYYNRYAELDAKNWKIIGAEAGFGLKDEVLVGENASVIVYWTGRPDLYLLDLPSNRIQPLDHKTTDYVKSNVSKQYKPHQQVCGYVYVGNVLSRQLGLDTTVDRCIINVAGRNRPSEKPRDGIIKPRFVRVYPNYSIEELAEWQTDIVATVTRMRTAIEDSTFIKHKNACHLYSGCRFRGVCSVTPSQRESIIRADYEVAEPWAPYTVEDDEETSE
jgi:hypothetical protein